MPRVMRRIVDGMRAGEANDVEHGETEDGGRDERARRYPATWRRD
jgi:hypothetical protein